MRIAAIGGGNTAMKKTEIRKWTTNDSGKLADICSRADRAYLSNRLPGPYTTDDALFWLKMTEKNEGNQGIFRAILYEGEYVGNISVEKKEDVYAKDAEIGYFILPEFYSRGIATEAVRQICQEAFNTLDIIRITGLVYSPNVPSKRVLEKNGFVCEGLMKQAVDKNGSIYDLCIYGKYR